ncbi:replication factor A protein [Trifolium repens]|nr:replication factor A protein [Trifolium repens]
MDSSRTPLSDISNVMTANQHETRRGSMGTTFTRILCLTEIEKLLRTNGRSLEQIKTMPKPDFSTMDPLTNKFVAEALNYDRDLMARTHSELINKLTSEQKLVHDEIVSSVESESGGFFFLYGYGAPAYDSIIDITSQKDDWCFFAKVIRLWKSIERKEHAEVVTTNLVLMDCYAQKIQATIGRELNAKFANVLREDNVYVMCNFKVELNELEVRTNTHKYILNFTNDTKVKCVHNGFLPIYSYFFTHPNVFLNHKYNPAVLVDVIGMLTNVAVENDYLIGGEMKKIVSMDLTNHGHSFKCILHGRCIDQLNDFLLSGNSDNAVVALFFGKVEIWKGLPVVQNTTTYTKLLFNPNLDATLDLKQSHQPITISYCHGFTYLDLLHGGTSIQISCGVVGSGEGKTNGRLGEVVIQTAIWQ